MNPPPALGFAGWVFLAFAAIALPVAAGLFALSERRADRARPDGGSSAADDVVRSHLYFQALFTHAVLLGVAIVATRAESISFTIGPLAASHVALTILTFLLVVAVGELSWRSRPPAERARLWVRRIVPRTTAERRLWIVVSAGAALAEEVAYRGVFVALATTATGSLSVAVVTSAIAFAIVHAPQGLSGVGYVFVIALLHQALVLLTGTLVFAILVHFAYDVVAGIWLARRHGLT